MPTQCEQHKTVLDLQVKLLLKKHYPIHQENLQLKQSIQQLEQKVLKYEAGGIFAIGATCLVVILVFRNKMKFQYTKEVLLDLSKNESK